MDSYTKLADDFFGTSEQHPLFKCVLPEDLEEVRVTFALATCDLEYADNFRLYTWEQSDEYNEHAARGCCGSFDSSIRCKSGNLYLIGCNFGH